MYCARVIPLLMVCLSLAVMNTGCATYYVMDRNAKNRDYATEFVQDTANDSKILCYDGRCSGTTSNAAGQWREYVFPGVLKGECRILKIRVPINIPKGIEENLDIQSGYRWDGPFVCLAETNSIPKPSTPARLVFMSYGAYSLESSLRTLKSEKPHLDISEYGSDTLIIADVYFKDDVVFFMNPSLVGQTQWRALPVKSEVKWKMRSRIMSVCGVLPYVLTVPFDIVTFPIQFILGIRQMGKC